jgi:hypothetical protein
MLAWTPTIGGPGWFGDLATSPNPELAREPLAADLATLCSDLAPQCPLEPRAKTVREVEFHATDATHCAVKTSLEHWRAFCGDGRTLGRVHQPTGRTLPHSVTWKPATATTIVYCTGKQLHVYRNTYHMIGLAGLLL